MKGFSDTLPTLMTHHCTSSSFPDCTQHSKSHHAPTANGFPSLKIAPSTLLFKQPGCLLPSKHPPLPPLDTSEGLSLPPQSRPVMMHVLVRNCYFTHTSTHHGVTGWLTIRCWRSHHKPVPAIPFPAARTVTCKHKQRLGAPNQEQQPCK